MIWFFALLSLLTLWVDLRFWRGRLSRGQRPWMALLILTALLPFISEVWSRCFAEDNTTRLTQIWMWLTWCYLLTIPSRLILYAGWWGGGRLWRRGAVGFTLLYLALLLHGTFYAPTHLKVVEQELRSERLPKGWDGARLLLLSDLHVGTMLNPQKECRALVDRINALQPDVVLFAGDLVHIRHSELDDKTAAILSEIQAPMGIYSVLGNHDIGSYIRDTVQLPRHQSTELLLSRQREMGWRVLSNEQLHLVRHGDSLSLVGIPFNPAWRHLRHDPDLTPWPEMERLLREVDTTRFTLILTHLPQLWEPIRSLTSADMTLAGHVHSMQHKIPIGQRGLSLARLRYPRWSGRYEEQGELLYINDGIGRVGIPTRLGAPPELTLFTLRSASTQ